MGTKISVLDEVRRREVFGDFNYNEIGGGRIQIDAGWVRANIVSCRLARANGAGKEVVASCHRKVKEPLEAAFAEVADRGLWRLIDSFDGMWVPRHKTWNSARALSSHSWGIAFDLNAATNPYGGGVSTENRALNVIFIRYGFAWGGDWKGAKDAMHWEMADLDAADRALEPPQPRLILALRHGPGFSYHAVPDAKLEGGKFSVEEAAVQRLLSLPAAGRSQTPGVRAPVRDVLQELDLKILESGDHLDDAHDPRYYVFVETTRKGQSSSPAVAPQSAGDASQEVKK